MQASDATCFTSLLTHIIWSSHFTLPFELPFFIQRALKNDWTIRSFLSKFTFSRCSGDSTTHLHKRHCKSDHNAVKTKSIVQSDKEWSKCQSLLTEVDFIVLPWHSGWPGHGGWTLYFVEYNMGVPHRGPFAMLPKPNFHVPKQNQRHSLHLYVVEFDTCLRSLR